MADKKISELPVASGIGATDISVLVSNSTDYQFSFSTLLSFIAANMQVGSSLSFGTSIPQNTTGNNGDVFLKTDTFAFYQKTSGTWALACTLPTGSGPDGTLLYGSGLPGSTIGADKDSYIDTSTGIFYLRTAGNWAQVFSMATGPQGPQGTAGANGTNGTNGNTILQGTTNPSNTADGVNGDYYINVSTYTFFGPKVAGVWGTGVSIIGPDGAAGVAGANGTAGTNGNTILYGSTDPVGTQGNNGDFYLNTATYHLFGPKASGTWPAGTDLIGAQGPAGSTGATGATGAAGVAGANGEGVPAGGTTGQVLAKIDSTDFNTQWVAQTGGSSIPIVTTGEKVLTQKSDGTHVDYDLQDQVVTAASLTTADFSSGIATVTGYEGQVAFDTNYRYDCVGINQWVRSAINGNLVDLYLADIDDTAGDKTSSDLQAAYPASLPGQQVWGVNKLYIKKTAIGWKKLTIADA